MVRIDPRYKEGVDYWNKDVDFYLSEKVRLLLAEFGLAGPYIYDILLTDAYREHGYYKKWDNDRCLLMSGHPGVGGVCSPKLIAEIVQGCVRRSLFDKRVLDMFGVLTSAEMQRRFLKMVGNSRDNIFMVKEYFLLDTSNRKDVTGATSSKLTFFSIAGKDLPENLKDFSENLKVSQKEQNSKEQNSISHIPARARAGEDEEDDGFSAFWAAYPKKSGDIRGAYTEYLHALDAGASLPDMLSALEWQKAQPCWMENMGQYVPSPEKWLRNRMWTQEKPKPLPPRKKNGKAETAQAGPEEKAKKLDAMKRMYAHMKKGEENHK